MCWCSRMSRASPPASTRYGPRRCSRWRRWWWPTARRRACWPTLWHATTSCWFRARPISGSPAGTTWPHSARGEDTWSSSTTTASSPPGPSTTSWRGRSPTPRSVRWAAGSSPRTVPSRRRARCSGGTARPLWSGAGSRAPTGGTPSPVTSTIALPTGSSWSVSRGTWSAGSTRATTPRTTRTSISACPFGSMGTVSSTNRLLGSPTPRAAARPRSTRYFSWSATADAWWPNGRPCCPSSNRSRWPTVPPPSRGRWPVPRRHPGGPPGTATDGDSRLRSRDPGDPTGGLTGLALESALAELAVRSEYIAELEAAVDRLGSDLDRHTRLRRSLRHAETTLANLLPVRVKEGLRGWLPDR